MPALKIRDPDGQVRAFSWPEGSVGLGRDSTNHAVLPNPKVERWHAAIFMAAGPSYRIRSLTGRAGISRGKERVRSRVLQDGDAFQIGPYELTFSVAASETDAAMTGRAPAVQLSGAETDPLGDDPKTRELRGPDWTDAGWWIAHEPDPTSREVLDLFVSVKAVASTLDVDEVLECLLEQVTRIATPNVSFAALVQDDDSLDVRARRMSSGRDPGPNGPEVSQSTIRHSVRDGLPILGVPSLERGSMHRLKIARALCLPLVADRRARGIVYADWKMDASAVEEAKLEWLAALAMYAGSAFENALHHDRLRTEHERLQSQHARLQQSQRTRTQIIGVSAATRQLLADVDRCAARDMDVLILGATGTGKELVARRIHECSKRRDGPFIAVNCAAIPRELFESEMFGILPGSLPGVPAGRPGHFREATRGTLFLDEFAELTLDHQARLLRALEDRKVIPVGGRAVPVDIRVIAATNRDLEKAVEDGRLRSDLYNRLGVPIRTTPLRDRPEDIPMLAYYLADRWAEAEGENWREISPKVMEKLLAHGWPGNVRELGRCLRSALVYAADRIELSDLRADPVVAGTAALPPLVEVEAEHIRRVLRATGGNQARAAKILKIAPNTLIATMRRHKIRREEFE